MNYNLGHWAEAHNDFTKALAPRDSLRSPAQAQPPPPPPPPPPNEIDEAIAKQVLCLIQLKQFEEAVNGICESWVSFCFLILLCSRWNI